MAPKANGTKMADNTEESSLVPNGSEQSPEAAMEEEQQQERSTESRLIITKIVNENFKSYAGKQELGPFHKVSESQPFVFTLHTFHEVGQ